jgi:hypothetical protein
MKALNWFGFIAASRSAQPREPGRLARIVELLGRGAIPVDGCDVPKKEPRQRRHEPVRWGNFR